MLQVFSLTNVPPEDQVLFGLTATGAPVTIALAAADPLPAGESIVWREGLDVALLTSDRTPRSPPGPGAPAGGAAAGDPEDTAPYLRQLASQWRGACTRAFYGEAPALQPVFAAAGTPGSLPTFVCYACSTTCFMPQQVLPWCADVCGCSVGAVWAWRHGGMCVDAGPRGDSVTSAQLQRHGVLRLLL